MMMNWPWSRLSCLLCRFRRERKGNVATIFALAIIPILGFIGVSVDFGNANSVKADMQSALDATALMLAKEAPDLSADELNSKALAYFDALFDHSDASNISISATYTNSGGSAVVVKSSADVPTSFMQVLGYDNITVGGSSTTNWGTSRLRVALVLDNTGSMADAGKMTALKSATKSLLSQLQSAAATDGDVYVSIIPFSKDVNVGAQNYDADWIDWSDWDDQNGSYQNTTSCSGGYSSSHGHHHSSHSSRHCNNSQVWVPADPSSAWNGCITDRGSSSSPGSTAGYDQKVDPPDPSNSDTLFPADQDSNCPVEMMGLNYNWTTMSNLVDSMQANGNTNQPIGLVWGWQSLVGGGPLTAPVEDANHEYQKIIILLSDGLNTEDRWYTQQTPIDNRMYQTGNGAGTCANIKAAGITIYAIQVNTGGDPTSTLLQNCASSSDKFYLLTSASGIALAFSEIGTNLAKLRLAK
jgi:Flp pilus assembly protein TadG